ncbi:MAG: TolC family protein [Gemmatimonadaceae bacterium]
MIPAIELLERGSGRRHATGHRAALLAAALAALGACAAGTPGIAGRPGAPAAPNRVWDPPRAARTPDSLAPAAALLPAPLVARASALTLADVVDLALQNNPATRASWAQARAAAAAYGVERASWLPRIDGAVNATRSLQPSANASNPNAGPLGRPRSQLVPSLSINYLIFDLGGRSGSVEAARQNAFALDFTHNAAVKNTVLQVEQAYFAYVGTRALLVAQRTSVEEAQASFDAARKRDSVGLATIADVLQARTALAQARLTLQTSEAQLQTARGALALALGVSPTVPYDVTARPEDVPVGEVTASVDSLIDGALRTRPELQAAYASAAAARASVRVARAAALPSLALTGVGGYTNSSIDALTGRNYSIGLGLQIPLFSGGARSYEIARAEALADAAAAQAQSLRQNVVNDVFTAYYDLRTATQQVRTSDDLLASATASLGAAQARYTGGVGSILDLLTAQAALATARAQQAQARWVWAQQLALLARASGALDAHGAAGLPVARDTTLSPLP